MFFPAVMFFLFHGTVLRPKDAFCIKALSVNQRRKRFNNFPVDIKIERGKVLFAFEK